MDRLTRYNLMMVKILVAGLLTAAFIVGVLGLGAVGVTAWRVINRSEPPSTSGPREPGPIMKKYGLRPVEPDAFAPYRAPKDSARPDEPDRWEKYRVDPAGEVDWEKYGGYPIEKKLDPEKYGMRPLESSTAPNPR